MRTDENLYSTAHKTNSQAFLDGWDRIWGKCQHKNRYDVTAMGDKFRQYICRDCREQFQGESLRRN
jgi:hypothetical protein